MTPDDARHLLDRLADRLEPQAFAVYDLAPSPHDGVEEVVGLSIAISLKRLADAAERLSARLDNGRPR